MRVNDFVVKFANVNGSGSASANRLFARSILRMGVPVASRNIFPSNIQGLPTWYEVRVSEAGYLGRRGGVDLMVAMNPQTWDKDVAEIEPGGYLFYDSTKPMPASKFRDDINVLGVPLTEICNERYSDPRQRQLFKNIIYVGALAALLGIEPASVEKLIAEQFKGKDKLIPPNYEALHLGRDYARARARRRDRPPRPPRRRGRRPHLHRGQQRRRPRRASMAARRSPPGIRSRPRPRWPRPSRAHCRRYRVDKATGKNRFAIVQAEDELASIGMVIGAAWNGARAFTATSGPGHLADAGVHRPRLFRRDSGGDLRRAARRPVDRHADAHAAVGPAHLRLRLARRHQARAALPGGPARMLRVRRRCPSTSPTGCRRRSSSCSTSTSA